MKKYLSSTKLLLAGAAAAVLAGCASGPSVIRHGNSGVTDWEGTNRVIDRMYARYAEQSTQALMRMAEAHNSVPSRGMGMAEGSVGYADYYQGSGSGAAMSLAGTGLDIPLTIKPYTGDIEDLVYVIGSRIDWRVISPLGIRVGPVTVTYAANGKTAASILTELGALVGRNAEIVADIDERTLQVQYPITNRYDPTDRGSRVRVDSRLSLSEGEEIISTRRRVPRVYDPQPRPPSGRRHYHSVDYDY